MKLKFSTKILIIAVLLTLIALAFFWFALQHPEMSFPFSLRTTFIVYTIYIIVTVLLYVIGILLKKREHTK